MNALKPATAIGLALLAVVASISCTAKTTAAEPRTVVRLAIGTPRLLEVSTKLMPSLSFEMVATGGSVIQLEALQDGRADVGNAMADVAYLASHGQLGGSSVTRLRKKIEPDPSHPQFILTAHGDGYCLCMNRDPEDLRTSVTPL